MSSQRDGGSPKVVEMKQESRYPAVTTSRQQIRRMLEITPFSHRELDAARIIYPEMQDTDTLNSFRELRTKLMQLAGKANFSVMVSSLVVGGGSTYVAENLAAAVALDFEKTALFLDCNKPTSARDKLINSTPEFGISDFLDDPTLTVSDIIYATGIPRLRKIPMGNLANAGSELFLSDRMEALIYEIKDRYPERYIILDAPPISTSPNARVLAQLCDFTVLVVPYGRATKVQIEAGINSIPKNKFAGVVFNN